ncbi:MAG: hypothetical protein FWC23_06145 [Chitinispirillia bacterium]|nr:hypothetical protein [Chitinispirillia bacterium]MCL2268748.1 hypothetical protein [Chitinispirillia bacterium]
MQFLTMRELSKTPKTALSRLTRDGKAVLTNNGKPAALLLNIDENNFERVFGLVQEVEKQMAAIREMNLEG